MSDVAITLTIPDGMEPEQVAVTLAAYLLGPRAFTNQRLENGRYRFGPYQEDPGRWQLDPSNDYWVRIEGITARLTCRYASQAITLAAMAAMFNCRYKR